MIASRLLIQPLATLGLFCVLSFAFSLPACSSQGTDADFNNIVGDIMKKAAGVKPGDAAADLFDTTSPDARRAAIVYFQTKKYGFEEPYMKAYRVLATDPAPMVAGQAMRALGASKRADTADVIVTWGLGSKHEAVREDATAALQQVRNPIAIPKLVELLRRDPSRQIRINAALALKGYQDPRVYRGLAEAMDDSDVGVSLSAYKSLKETANVPGLPNDSRAALEWVDQHYPATAPASIKPG